MRKLLLFVFLFALTALTAPQSFSAPPSADAFGTLPNAYDAAISPNGKQVAIIVNINGDYGVRVVTLGKKKEKLRAIVLGKGVKPSWVKWVNDERVLVGLWESEKVRGIPITVSFIYTLDTNQMKGKILVKNDKIFRQDNSDVVDFLEDDPDHILMAFSDVNQLQADVNKVNVKTGRYRTVKRNKRDVQNWYTDRRGIPRVGQGLVDRTVSTEEQWNLVIRGAEEDRWRKADHYPGLEANQRIFGFTDNPNELVILRANFSTMIVTTLVGWWSVVAARLSVQASLVIPTRWSCLESTTQYSVVCAISLVTLPSTTLISQVMDAWFFLRCLVLSIPVGWPLLMQRPTTLLFWRAPAVNYLLSRWGQSPTLPILLVMVLKFRRI